MSSHKEAEFTKLLENMFRHVKVGIGQRVAMFANNLGIDVWEAIAGADAELSAT